MRLFTSKADIATERVRQSQTSNKSRRGRLFRKPKPENNEVDQRETRSKGSRTRTQKRIAPEATTMKVDHQMNSMGAKRNLHVDTNCDAYSSDDPTAGSTPSPQGSTRGSSDWRSPGQKKTPVAGSSAPIPDFITQTDANGNAVTPRSAAAVSNARVESGAKHQKHLVKQGSPQDVDACTETLLDSFRLMCCCLLGEEAAAPLQKTNMITDDEDTVEEVFDDDEQPRLLPPIHRHDIGKKCLVLDLDETLVHSSFRAVPGADFVIPVQIEDVVHFVYVMKRPGVDEFLVEMAKHYELVIYTASLNKYADPLLDLLDPQKCIRSRLFRESCVFHEGNYVKDLSLLDRDLSQSIIIDNSPSSYSFHPHNAIDCSSFIDDPRDRELDQIAAFLTGVKDVNDVRDVCHQWREWPNVNIMGQ